MINKLIVLTNLFILPLFSIAVPPEALSFFESNESLTLYGSGRLDEKTLDSLLPYAAQEKKEYDGVILAGIEELERIAPLLKKGGKGIVIVPYQEDSFAREVLQRLGMEIVYQELRREIIGNGPSAEWERNHLIFFEKQFPR